MESGFLSFWLIINSCSSQPSFSLPANPSSVAVNSDSGEVFVAAGAQLLRLDGQLRLLVNEKVSSELLRIALSPGGGRLVGSASAEAPGRASGSTVW